MTDQDRPLTWSRMFRKSTIHPLVRVVVDPDPIWSYIRRWNLPVVQQSGVFDSFYQSAAVLDGMVIYREKYGWSGLPTGTHILGPRVVWLFVHALGIRPPKSILGIPDPGRDRLFEEVRAQGNDADMLVRANWGLGVGDSWNLLGLIETLWPGSVAELTPPPGWVDSGFMRPEADKLTKVGVSPEQAIAWRAAGLSLDWILDLHNVSLAEAGAWNEMGMASYFAARALAAGITLADVARFVAEGSTPAGAVALMCAGMTLDDWRSYRDAGVSQYDADGFFEADIPLADAKDWVEAGVRPKSASTLRDAGFTVEDYLRWIQAGVRTPIAWMCDGFSIDEAIEWQAVPLDRLSVSQVRVLLDAGVDPRTARRMWRRGAREPAQIVACMQDEQADRAARR